MMIKFELFDCETHTKESFSGLHSCIWAAAVHGRIEISLCAALHSFKHKLDAMPPRLFCCCEICHQIAKIRLNE